MNVADKSLSTQRYHRNYDSHIKVPIKAKRLNIIFNITASDKHLVLPHTITDEYLESATNYLF